MSAPRSSIPPAGRWMVIGALALTLLVSLRFLLLGAWPVMIFALLDIGALALALHLFSRSQVEQEWLRASSTGIELVRVDGRGRTHVDSFPPVWTRVEARSRSETDFQLELVASGRRRPIGLCLTAEERREIHPHVQRLLAKAGSRQLT
ncbi:DUF2244 domain-containing protein [Sandaracinobacteroides hominis]|uniref:DUF2244 domain-containing protein n=1 Tax=Sandaracinobacteroides hominis TaxID=2780086 RepID=UPI0018F492A2|nr:DUF2244 domain-containing protein [Sandaracinobacteroides hominis]